jgi:hypothetical protein
MRGVWVSHAPSDPTLSDGLLKSTLSIHGDQQLIEIAKFARNGGVVHGDQFPTEAWGEVGEYRAHHFPNHWPDISNYNGLWLISGNVADILRGFKIGDGVISPVRLFRRDHVTLVPGDWLFWNVGNTKEAFLPDRSTHIRPVPGRAWRTLGASDLDLKCSTAAEAGPDVWFDHKLRGVLFLGFELGQALIAADLANERAGFGKLVRCEVIET